MTAIQVISDSAKAVGIKITPSFPEYDTMVDDRGHAQLRPAARQRPAVQQHAVDVLPVHLPAADPGQPDHRQLRAVHGPERLEPHAAAGQDADDQHEGLPGRDDAAAEDVPAGPARDSALVQRHVGDVQHEVLDELALVHGQPVHAHLLAELLADDEHRHAHAPAPARRKQRSDSVTGRHPSRLRPGGVLRPSSGIPTGSLGDAIPRTEARCIYLVTFWVAVTIDWAIPRFMPGDPIAAAPLADAGAAGRGGGADRLLHEGVRVRRPALEAVPQLLGGALPRRPRAQHLDFPTPVSDADPAARCRTRSRCSSRRSCSASGPGTRSARSPRAARRSTTPCCRSPTC